MSRSSTDEIIKGYIEEVTTYIPTLKQGIESLRKKPDQTAVVEEVHRLTHTIKGASSMVGIYGLSHIAYQMEDTLDEIIAGKLSLNDKILRVMAQTVDRFQTYCLEYLDKGVKAQTMLKETVSGFRRVRGLPPEQDDAILKPLLQIVPEIEGGKPEVHQDEDDELLKAMMESVAEEETLAQTPISEDITEEIPVPSPPEESVSESSEPAELPDIPAELMQSFNEESEEHLEDLGRSLNILETQITTPSVISPDQREIIRLIRRSVHTLKGASAVIGFSNVASWAHHMEDLLDWLYETAHTITPELIKILVDSADLLDSIVSRPQDPQTSKVNMFRAKYVEIMKESQPVVQETKDERTAIPEKSAAPSSPEIPSDMPQALPMPEEIEELPQPSTDEEHVEEVTEEMSADMALRQTRTLRVGMERVDELVNLTGELIIALSGFDQKMERFRNSINELELSRDRLRDIARDMEVGYEVKALSQIKGIKGAKQKRAYVSADIDDTSSETAAEFEDFDSLELDRYSELNLIIRTLNEAVIDIGAIQNQMSNLHSDFDGHLTRQRVVLSELQNKMMRVRMTPMSSITNKLRRTAREVAAKLGKKIRLIIEGANIELDRLVWEKLTDPLMHLLRNAADHGIEPPALRQALGKPAIATIKLIASREGNQVVIRIIDDGAGINFDAIRATAKTLGHLKVDEMTEDQLTSLIFIPGFSTRGKISEVSGRGVGMDVVKSNIIELKGVIHISSQKGKGAQFSIRIPLTLAAVRALLFTVGGQIYAVALNEISEIFRIDPKTITKDPEDAVRIGDEVLPLYYLTEVLHKKRAEEKPLKLLTGLSSDYPIVLIVESAGQRAAMVVDVLIGQKEIVIKSTGSHLRYIKGISGATIMGDGSVVPILNVGEIILTKAVVAEKITPLEVGAVLGKSLQIMVVDDSVSIRQVISRLMEDQGWKVQTAKDGIDALEKLREYRPDLIVLDIEMPRMNGYEFLSAVRTQPAYAKIPVVMLTSRTAAKHRQKALSLGAKGFIVKPYNDEDFVNLVLKLTETRG